MGQTYFKMLLFAATDRDVALACSIHLLDWANFLCMEQLFLPCLDRVWWWEVCVLSFLDSLGF